MKTALVLSGGGANGHFQVGALDVLFNAGVQFDVVAGVSVGALNGVMVAQNKFPELKEIWKTITNEKVFTRYRDWRAVLRLVAGRRSLYDLSPLRDLIGQHVCRHDLVMPFYCGVVDMEQSNYNSISEFDSSTDLRDAVYCSSIMPVIWSPSTLQGYPNFADGGLRNIAPLADVISELPDKIYIIACQPENLSVAPLATKWPAAIYDLKRVIEIFTNEIINNDVDKLLDINDLVLQAREQGALLINKKTGKSYKYFECEVIRPDAGLGDATDFSKAHTEKCFAAGVAAAKKLKTLL